MFRKMRREKQALSREECLELLEKASSGVLALLGDGDYPYALPISFVYSKGSIFFHSALEGHKVDAVRGCPRASFCVVAQDRVIPEKYTSAYKSVIAFGRMRLLEEPEEKLRAAVLLGEKYYPGHPEQSRAEAEKYLGSLLAMELEIEHMSGKQGRELL